MTLILLKLLGRLVDVSRTSDTGRRPGYCCGLFGEHLSDADAGVARRVRLAMTRVRVDEDIRPLSEFRAGVSHEDAKQRILSKLAQ